MTELCEFCQNSDARFVRGVQTANGIIYVCGDCLAYIVRDALDDRRKWRREFCAGCQQLTADGGCLQGVTPETCA